MRRKKNFRLVGLVVVLLAGLGGTAHAASAPDPAASPWAETDQARVRLIGATTSVGSAQTLRLGLEFRLAPGWKTYWRSPGDAGFPPRPEWSGSANVAAVTMRWPAPHRFELFGLDSFGYGDEVVFPLDVRVSRPGEPLTLGAKVDYLICEKICIPYTAELALDLPAGPANPSAHAHLINRFAAQVPDDGTGAGLAIESAEWRAGASPAIVVQARAMTPFGTPDVFVEAPAGWSFGRAQARLSDGGTRAELRLPLHGEGAAPKSTLANSDVTLTLVDGARAAERTLRLIAGAPSRSTSSASFIGILALAVLGGLILNLMPCVLPVLSLKLLGVVSHGGGSPARVRASFVASAAGILAAFLLLAGVLTGLKQAGVAVGWGIQFQQPAFLVFMVLLVALFAANLWDWFHIRLPDALADAAIVDTPSHNPPTIAGSFATGVFATLLATPCSAPFLGTAVGFALARGPAEIFAVFGALGLGLAMPYVLVAAVPAIATRLPRPGPWMIRLRRALGFALIATAIWLLTILAAEIGRTGALSIGGLMIAGLGVLWLGRRTEAPKTWIRGPALALIALVAFTVPGWVGIAPTGDRQSAATSDGPWRPFALDEISGLVRAGQVVFVDVTADWCITCQVNKSLVLGRGEVAARLAGDKVVAQRADWTRPDDKIASYLASFGRYGIPFYAVYGPGAPAGIALPEILTADVVLEALDRAGGRPTSRAAAE